MTDIIDQIDAVIGCQQCGRALGQSPSDDFCSEPCQSDWHGGRSVAMALPTDHSDYRTFVQSILERQINRPSCRCSVQPPARHPVPTGEDA